MGVDADLWLSALRKARAGDVRVWDDVANRLSTSVNTDGSGLASNAVADGTVAAAKAVGDGVVIAAEPVDDALSAWECKKCPLCQINIADKFQKPMIPWIVQLLGAGITEDAVCSASIDPASLALCTVMTAAIPVPGLSPVPDLSPVVCPPLILLARQKCPDLVGRFSGVLGQNPTLLTAATSGTLKVSDISNFPGLKPLDFCNSLGLCPTTGANCLPADTPPVPADSPPGP